MTDIEKNGNTDASPDTGESTSRLPRPGFIDWLVKEDDVLIDGAVCSCFRLNASIDDTLFDEWAVHIRRHYQRDKVLRDSMKDYPGTQAEYLARFVIPDKPEMRGGDFAEIIIQDLLEFMQAYTVSRWKHLDRVDKNCSEHGNDVIAYLMDDPDVASLSDELVVVEVKSEASSGNLKRALTKAAYDSANRDEARLAITLDYHRRRSRAYGDMRNAKAMARFMDKGEHSYKNTFAIGAVAGVKDAKRHLDGATASDLGIQADTPVFVIHRERLMELIHDVYNRCCA